MLSRGVSKAPVSCLGGSDFLFRIFQWTFGMILFLPKIVSASNHISLPRPGVIVVPWSLGLAGWLQLISGNLPNRSRLRLGRMDRRNRTLHE